MIRNAEVLLPNHQIKQQDILIEDDKIAAIGNLKDCDNAEMIDGTNQLVVPGFINTHTHAAMTLFRSYADDMALMDWLEKKIWPAEAHLTEEDVYWGTMLAIAEMIQTGTTTFADMYFFMDAVAKAVDESGIRAVLARGMAGVAPTANQALIESKELYLNFHNKADGRIRVMLGPHAPYTCPPDYLKKVISLSEELNAEIHIHLAETRGEVETCIKKFGKTPIAHMDDLGLLDRGVLAAHCVHLTENDMDRMASKKVRVAHNPGSNMKLASGIAPIPKLLGRGIPVGLGTDGTASNNNLDLLEEIRLSALLHKVDTFNPEVIPAAQAIDLGTSLGAKCLNWDQEIGQIDVGYKADIILFNMNRTNWYPRHDRLSLLAYSASAQDISTVIVNGQVLLRKGQLTTIDIEKVYYEANRRGLRLVKN